MAGDVVVPNAIEGLPAAFSDVSGGAGTAYAPVHSPGNQKTSLVTLVAACTDTSQHPANPGQPVIGFNGASILTIQALSGTGSVTFKCVGSMDGTVWYDIGLVKRYDSAGGVSTSPAMIGSDTLAASVRGSYDLQHYYDYVAIVATANTLSAGYTAQLKSVPQ